MHSRLNAPRGTRSHLGARLWLAFSLVALGACQADRTTGLPSPDGASLAKGASGGGAGANPTVTSTSPTSAPQDTVLDVHIFGSGYAKGARATWSLAGDTTKVHVNSTKVVSSSELIANLTVPSTAPIGNYDVVVTLSSGKKGVGAELFAVTEGNASVTWRFPLADAGLSVRSDHQFSDGTYSLYADGVCSVNSSILVTGSGDNVMGFDYPRGRKGCGRTWTVSYPDGYTETLAYGSGVQVLESTSFFIPVGTTTLRHFRFGTAAVRSNPSASRCGQGLVFGPNGANPALGSDSVRVTRIDASTWHVQSQAPPNDHAYCIDNGQLYEMQIDFTIVADRPLR